MSKFNTTLERAPKVENYAGGEAYKQSSELELVSILLTSFVTDTFYRSSNDTLVKLTELLSKVSPEFAAKAAIFARDEFGMRSITHALAGELTSYVSGQEWAKEFYNKVVVRPDDMTEILAYYISKKTDSSNPKFPNSLKKGFAKAFDKFDDYQIAKYKNEKKEVKLVDVVNLVHPVPSSKNKTSLKKLIDGELKSSGTWESKLSQAGQEASSKEELAEMKADAWRELITERKIGYFALLRNLRNILSQAPELVTLACELLVDENMISKSRVLPFRFKTAYDEIMKLDSSKTTREVVMALDKALDLSVKNVPVFDGETLVVIDTSGSMSGKPSEIASLFGAILAKSNNCDVMTFDTTARYETYRPNDSVMSIRDSFKFRGGGTNLHNIFKVANKSYENIIILSDFQGWIGHYTPTKVYQEYKKTFNCNPYLFSFDLAGLGTLSFPENNVFCLAGFSDKVFDVIKLLKEDKKALVNRINSISL